jgi:hypothetical protein
VIPSSPLHSQAAVLARLPGIHIKVTVAWQHVFAGAGPAMQPMSTAAWNTDQMTGLPELDIARVRRRCEQRVPEHARDRARVECDSGPRHLTIVECRPPRRQSAGSEWTRFPIARLRYTRATRTWALYGRDRNLRFHLCGQLEPSPDIGDLLREIDRDPIAIFWG